MIETERLLLRVPVLDDVDAVADEIGDPEVMRYVGDGSVRSHDDAVEQIASMRRAWAADGFGRFTVLRREDGFVLGRVGFLAWDPEQWQTGTRAVLGARAEVELGWTLRRTAWGHGYATEAALAARDWSVREFGFTRLISLFYPENVRSMRVGTKIGEQFEREISFRPGLTLQLWSRNSLPLE